MLEEKHKLLLVPFHQHLSSLYAGLIREGCEITGLVHFSHLRVRKLDQVKVEPVHFFVGYPMVFYKWFTIGFQAPKFIPNFSKKVKRIHPTTLIVFDIYHWYFLQVIRIKRTNPEYKLIVYSESKQWPKRKLSSFVLRFFLQYATKYQHYIDQIFVYTTEGKDFLSKYISPEKISILPPPINTRIFNTSKERISSSKKVLKILCNARFDSYKRHEDLLLALPPC